MSTSSTPPLIHFCDLRVQVGKPQEVGTGPRGLRRLIPILGGQVTGRDWAGRVLPGGADHQLIVTGTMTELDARYVIETDAGDCIYVRNRAIRVAAAEITARLARGEPVDPSLVYFRCSPAFETASPALAWICERFFVGTGIRQPAEVQLQFFELG